MWEWKGHRGGTCLGTEGALATYMFSFGLTRAMFNVGFIIPPVNS